MVGLRKTIGNAYLTFDGLKVVLLDVEIALNGCPLSYIQDDVQLPVLTPNSMLSNLSQTFFLKESHLIKRTPNSDGERNT